MAEAAGGGGVKQLLTSKWGPAPVWVYALGVLILAWVYSKYRTMKSDAAAGGDQPQAAGGDYAAEGQDVAPQFIIENNMPQVITPGPAPATLPSAPVPVPVTTLPGKPPVTITPPGTTTHPPVMTKPQPPAVKSPPAKRAPLPYKVVAGDSLSKIAAKHTNPETKKKFTWQELWTFNTTPGNRPASAIATLKKRGPNKIFPGETILIPQ